MGIGLTLRIKPATSCSAVKHSTDWANPAVVSQGNKVNNTKESKVAGFEPPSWHYAANFALN